MSTIQPNFYFDYNASAFIAPEVMNLFTQHNYGGGNPSATHAIGRQLSGLLDDARCEIRAAFKSCDDNYSIIFTSGATESNNMIMYSWLGPTLVSETEHVSVLNASASANRLPVDHNGIVDLTFLENWLSTQHEKALVSVMYANNETGVLQPVQDIAALCRKYKAFFHCDLVQIFGKFVVDIQLFDAVSISAHKLGGLPGCGAVIYHDQFPIQSLMHGGPQQLRKRAGTENVVGAISFIGALKQAKVLRDTNQWDEIRKLRDFFEDEILKISPQSVVASCDVNRLPNTSVISMPGVGSEKQVMLFDLCGVFLSAGASCSSGVIKESHVLKAMGLPHNVVRESIRISLQPQTTQSDIEYLIKTWKNIFNQTRHAQ